MAETDTERPIRSLLLRLAVLMAAILLALGIAELAVRAAGLAPPVKAIWLSDDENVYRRSDNPILGFELKPSYRNDNPNPNHSYPSTNAHGQRDVERELTKAPGVTRALLLGDSVVEGHGIMEIDATISRQLESLLSASDYEVLNFGVSGYCTLSEVELLATKGLRFEPDVVILLFVSNDFRNFNPIAFELEGGTDRPEWTKHLFLASHLFRLTSLRLDLWGFGQEPELSEWNSQAIGDNNVVDGLRRFAELARTHGFRSLVAIWPNRADDGLVDEPSMGDSGDLIVERLAAMYGLATARLSGPLREHLQSNPGLSARELYLTGDTLHPSALGSRLAAQGLAELLTGPERPALPAATPTDDDPEAIAAATAFGESEVASDARVHNNRGRRLREEGDLEAAETEFQEALAIDPNLPEAHFNLGVVYQRQGRIAEARRSYESSLAIDPENEEANHNLGLILLDEGSLAAAQERFELAILIEPEYANAHLGLGNVLARGDRLDEAREAFRCAIDLDPESASAHNNLGNTFLAVDQAAESLPHYRRAVELEPDHFQARHNLARALELTGAIDEAVSHYREASRLRPDHPAPRAALERLASQSGPAPGRE